MSGILKNELNEFEKKLGEWLPKTGDWRICWRATRDGWAASTFHSNCDGKLPTITIVQVIKNNKKFVFGGYATVSWKQAYSSSKFEMITLTYMIYYFNHVSGSSLRSILTDSYWTTISLIGFVTCIVRQWLQLLWYVYRDLLMKLDKNTIRICWRFVSGFKVKNLNALSCILIHAWHFA